MPERTLPALRQEGGAAPAAALFWIACGFAVFTLLPFVYRQEKASFAVLEPFYDCPVALATPGTALIRNDEIGKGHFGAPRNNNRTHKGIDLYAPLGSPVLAAKSGRVYFVDHDEKGYGVYIELRHPDGLLTRYAHLASVKAVQGEWVARGEVIGTVGKTGNADAPQVIPHLHFEIRYGQQALNPSEALLDPALTLRQS